MNDELVERLIAVLMPEIGNDVRQWPAQLRDMYRNGQYRSLADRSAAVELERRRMDARAVLAQLHAEGWRPAESSTKR